MKVLSKAPAESARRPSPTWRAIAVLTLVLALALAVIAVRHQQMADRPIGEGELFLDDAMQAEQLMASTYGMGMGSDEAVRHVRNQLTTEAVSITNPDGSISSSTSNSLVGTSIENGLLQFGHFDRRFVAVAFPLTVPLELDGVVEWSAGDVLYHSLQPLDDGSSLVLSYDISELFERRARAAGIRSTTVQLLGLALLAALCGAGLLIARSRAARKYEQLILEADFLRTRSTDLQRHNTELDEALALSEETNRVRGEFVLMINHELRTPLTGVVTGAELLVADVGMDSTDREQLLSDVVTDGRRLEEIIAQMLAVARIENRGMNFELSEIGSDQLSAELSRRLPDAEFDSQCPDVTLRTDVETLSQIVSSLIDNARTHGAQRVWVEYLAELPFHPMERVGSKPMDAFHLAIHDDGPGIDPEFLPRAFQKFEKNSPTSGTGLGLYMVSVMVKALGASLDVTTGPDGTTMALALPIVPAVLSSGVEL